MCESLTEAVFIKGHFEHWEDSKKEKEERRKSKDSSTLIHVETNVKTSDTNTTQITWHFIQKGHL